MNNSSDNHINLAVDSVSVGFVGRLTGRFLVVLQSLLIARVLGPSIFGLYAIGLGVFRLLEMLVSLGFDVGVIRFGSQYLFLGDKQKYNNMIINSLVISFLFSSAIGLIVYIYSGWISINLYQDPDIKIVFQMIAILIPLSAMLSVIVAIGRINNQVRYSIIMQDLIQPLLAFSFLILFWLIGLRLELVIFADQLSYFLATLVILFFVLKTTDTFSSKNKFAFHPEKAYYSFSFLSVGSVFLSTVVFYIDRLLAGVYLSPADVGIYQASIQLAALFAVVSGAFNRNILPVFSTLYAEKKMQEFQDIYRIGTKWNFYLWCPFILFLFFNSTNILQTIYGDAYSYGNIVLIILLIGQTVNLLTGSVGIVLLVGGFQRFILKFSFVALLINVFFCIALIPEIGIVGAALSSCISTVFLYSSLIVFTLKKMKLFPYDIQYIKGIIAVGITVGTILITKWLLDDFTLIYIVVEIFLIILVFFMSLIFLGLSQDDKLFLRLTINRLGILNALKLETDEQNKT